MNHNHTNKRRCLLSLLAGCVFLFTLVGCAAEEQQEIFLTEEERQWLDEHEGQITIGYTTDYPPVELLINGEYVGISAEYFALLEEKLQTTIEMVEFDEWNELIEKARTKEIAGITAATKTQERSEYLSFTVPYIFNPNVIITRKNFSEKLSFGKLEHASMDVLVIAEYAIIEYLEEHHPMLEYRTVPTTSDGLRQVSFGEADAMIIEVMSAAAGIDQDNITNLIVNTETPYESTLSIATRKDWPLLNDIFNKGLAQISAAERQAIREKWIPFERRSIFENRYFWIVLAFVFTVLSGTIVAITMWNKTLQKAVTEKTEELEKSKEKLMEQNKQLEITERKLLQEIEIRKKSEEKIKYKSYHDDLTGLHNRAHYNEKLEMFTCKPEQSLSILMIDLNGLKITNDTLGHKEGDRLLIKAAQIIQSCCGPEDVIARIGGDEFVVLLPEATEEAAEDIAGKIKKTCKEAGKDPIDVSMAIGWATRMNNSKSLEVLFKEAEDHMYENKMHENESEQTSILSSLKALLRETTGETFEHSQRMEEMAIHMGQKLGLEEAELRDLATLADLHDLGIVGVSEEILHKPAPLNEEEWGKVKRHPSLGYKIVNTSPKLGQIAEAILTHHEHWDGRGYPQGLKGEDIPLLARIITIVDAYDVMTHDQPYKTAISQEEAMVELKRCAGTQFDPDLVDVFLRYIN